jgi:hypothetical protein
MLNGRAQTMAHAKAHAYVSASYFAQTRTGGGV